MSLDDAIYYMGNVCAIADKASIKKKVKVAQVEVEEPTVAINTAPNQGYSADSGLFAPPAQGRETLYRLYNSTRNRPTSVADVAGYVAGDAPRAFRSTTTPMSFDIESYEDPF